MVTNVDLQNMYLHFNKRYFGNRLYKGMVVAFEDLGRNLGVARMYRNTALYINISKNLRHSNVLVAMTLLHEMVHVEFPTIEHGPKFNKRMLKLAKQGAFNKWW